MQIASIQTATSKPLSTASCNGTWGGSRNVLGSPYLSYRRPSHYGWWTLCPPSVVRWKTVGQVRMWRWWPTSTPKLARGEADAPPNAPTTGRCVKRSSRFTTGKFQTLRKGRPDGSTVGKALGRSRSLRHRPFPTSRTEVKTRKQGDTECEFS